MLKKLVQSSPHETVDDILNFGLDSRANVLINENLLD
jgi:hypothetical protein